MMVLIRNASFPGRNPHDRWQLPELPAAAPPVKRDPSAEAITLAGELRAFCKRHARMPSGVCRAAGLSPQYLQRLEDGNRPRPATAEKLRAYMRRIEARGT